MLWCEVRKQGVLMKLEDESLCHADFMYRYVMVYSRHASMDGLLLLYITTLIVFLNLTQTKPQKEPNIFSVPVY